MIFSVTATLLFFPDWVTQILPDVVRLYEPLRAPDVPAASTALAAIALITGGAIFALVPAGPQRQLACSLVAAALICIVPFFVQGRGFFYHLFPFFGFLGMAVTLLLDNLFARETDEGLSPFLAILTGAAICYATIPPATGLFHPFAKNAEHFPTQKDYASLPLTRMVDTCDGRGAPCPFFLFYGKMGLIQETAYYSGVPHSSRFPTFWFLTRLLDPDKTNLPDAERRRLLQKYTAMVTQDFNRYRPKLVLIGRFDIGGRPFDFVRYFGADPDFARAFAPYHFERRVMLDNYLYDMHSEQQKLPIDIFVRDAP